jgi:hypothetical protein
MQEKLDVHLFDLPWNAVLVGDEPSEEEVGRLSRRFRGDEASLRDYYLVAAVAAPHDVLFCFEQNLAWGSRVRQRYAAALLGARVTVRHSPVAWSAAPTGNSNIAVNGHADIALVHAVLLQPAALM